jgi:hypothetical protein
LQGFKDLSVEARYKTWTDVNVNPIEQGIFAGIQRSLRGGQIQDMDQCTVNVNLIKQGIFAGIQRPLRGG